MVYKFWFCGRELIGEDEFWVWVEGWGGFETGMRGNGVVLVLWGWCGWISDQVPYNNLADWTPLIHLWGCLRSTPNLIRLRWK